MADQELLRELNRDIWHPFRESYGALDASAFLALHAPELIRAGGPDKQVCGYPEYAAQIEEWFATLRERGETVTIDFRFTERLAAGGLASERGLLRITATRPSGESKTFYGQFHTLARKVEDTWRITADYDANPGTLTEEDFRAGAEIDS